ncbi:hypothetical protein CS8_077040 [Cupriavidus sp. 8B]
MATGSRCRTAWQCLTEDGVAGIFYCVKVPGRGGGCGNYSKAADWQSYALAAQRLVTGQNPASAAAAEALLKLLKP